MNIFIAGPYPRRDELNAYKEVIESAGHTVVARWLDPCNHLPDALHDASSMDIEDLMACDAIMMQSEEKGVYFTGGRMVEFGVALAKGLRMMVVGRRENVHTHHMGDARFGTKAVELFEDWSEAIAAL